MLGRCSRIVVLSALVSWLALGSLATARAEDGGRAAAVVGADFDAFWATQLKTFRAVPLRATVKHLRDDAGVSLSEVFYDSVKKVRIHATLAVPAGGGKHPGLVIVPGLGDRGRAEWALEGARHGFTTLTLDLRGQGQSKGCPPDVVAIYMFSRLEDHFITGCVADVLRGVDFLAEREEVDARWLFVQGFSLGGGLSISVSALDSRIRAAAIGAPAFCDFERAARESKDPRMAMLRAYLQGTPDPEAGLHQLSFVDNCNFAARIDIPVLFGMCTDDPTVDFQGVRRAFERIPTSDKEFIEHEGRRHTIPPGFLEKSQDLFRRVMGWELM